MSLDVQGDGVRAPAIETFDLVRRFGDFTAVDRINLRVRAGAFFGFLGPNGAGKATTIKMLTGLLAPTAGRASGLGHDIAAGPVGVKRRMRGGPRELNQFERPAGAGVVAVTGGVCGPGSAGTSRR